MSGKTVTAQARPDPMPVAGQRPGPPFFAILIVAGLIVIGAGSTGDQQCCRQPERCGEGDPAQHDTSH